MSGYDKKYIKGEHKKDCFKKEDEKDCCEKDCCKKDYCEEEYHREEEKGIYTELQVSEAMVPSAIGNVPDTPTVATAPPLIQITRKTICVDDSTDRVLVNGTVEWAPFGTATEILLVLPLLLSIPVSFKVWRKNRSFSGNTTPELIFETTDSSPGLAIITAVGTTFGSVTTSFQYVDEDPNVGENEYILTMESALPLGLIAILVAAGIIDAGAFLPVGLTLSGAVTSYVFTLAEIEANN